MGGYTDSVRDCLKWYSHLFKTQTSLFTAHCHISNYEIQLKNMKSIITSLKKRVNSLENKVSNLQQPIVPSNNDQSQMNTDGALNQTATHISPPTTDDSTNHISSLVNQTLSPGGHLLIGDYKRPLQKGLEHFHCMVHSTHLQIL